MERVGDGGAAEAQLRYLRLLSAKIDKAASFNRLLIVCALGQGLQSDSQESQPHVMLGKAILLRGLAPQVFFVLSPHLMKDWSRYASIRSHEDWTAAVKLLVLNPFHL